MSQKPHADWPQAVASATVFGAQHETNFETNVPGVPLLHTAPHRGPRLLPPPVPSAQCTGQLAGRASCGVSTGSSTPSSALPAPLQAVYTALSPSGPRSWEGPGHGGSPPRTLGLPAPEWAAPWAPLWTRLPGRKAGDLLCGWGRSESRCTRKVGLAGRQVATGTMRT